MPIYSIKHSKFMDNVLIKQLFIKGGLDIKEGQQGSIDPCIPPTSEHLRIC